MATKTPALVPKGGLLMGVLVDGSTHAAQATKANLDAWITGNNKTPNTWVWDPTVNPPEIETFLNRPYDSFLIVDLKTMRIVRISSNDGMAALAAFEQLL